MTIYTAALYVLINGSWYSTPLGILNRPHGKEANCEVFYESETKYKKFCTEEVKDVSTSEYSLRSVQRVVIQP